MFQSGTTADDVIVCLVFVYMSQSATMAAPRRCPSGVVRASLAPRPTLSLSVLYHLSQNGTTTAPVVVRGVQCCSCQSDNHPCHWSMSFVSKWDHGRPCHCLSDVVCPKMGLQPRLSLSVWCCPYHCCLSHAVCLKVGPRPPLSLSVWCRPYHSPAVVCPMQSVSKWDHDRLCRCLSGVVRVRLAPRPFPSSPAPLHDHVAYLGAEARPAVVKSAISLRCFDVLD